MASFCSMGTQACSHGGPFSPIATQDCLSTDLVLDCAAASDEPHLLPKAIRGLLRFVSLWRFARLGEQYARSRDVVLHERRGPLARLRRQRLLAVPLAVQLHLLGEARLVRVFAQHFVPYFGVGCPVSCEPRLQLVAVAQPAEEIGHRVSFLMYCRALNSELCRLPCFQVAIR